MADAVFRFGAFQFAEISMDADDGRRHAFGCSAVEFSPGKRQSRARYLYAICGSE